MKRGKKLKAPTFAEMVNTTRPRFVAPGQVFKCKKRDLTKKAIRKAEQEDR